MRMLIKNGRVIDPASNTDDIRDILVEDGVIAEVAKDIDKAADTVIDAKGCMVMPGLVDLHVHFREPGFEHKETIWAVCWCASPELSRRSASWWRARTSRPSTCAPSASWIKSTSESSKVKIEIKSRKEDAYAPCRYMERLRAAGCHRRQPAGTLGRDAACPA